MLVVKNCSIAGDNFVAPNQDELREWHASENFPFIRVIDTEKHNLLVGKMVEHKKDFMRVPVPLSTNPTGYITIPSEYLLVDNERYTINQFFKEFEHTSNDVEEDIGGEN